MNAPKIETEGVELAPTLVQAEQKADAQVVFQEAVVASAQHIVDIACGDLVVPRQQYDAAKYVVDRVLGTIPKASGDATNPWGGLVDMLRGANDGKAEM